MSDIKIYLVRHGKAAAGFASHRDPGLDATGRRQAEATAALLADIGPLPIYASPMARAYETALPLANLWHVEHSDIQIEPRVAEIPSPTDDLEARAAWLGEAMQGTWDALEAPFQAWRQALHECLLALSESCVIFSHYVAINAAVGLASSDSRMRIFAPDNGSITTLTVKDGQLHVNELGRTAATKIN
ncbi:MAG: histidine phosphatase family protein [Pseudomonadota bacterium]